MSLLFALALTLLALALPAHATILFASGEDSGFNAVGTAVGTTGGASGTAYRANYARANIAMENGTSTADPPANRMQTQTFSAQTTLWIHAQVWPNGAGELATTSGEQALIIRSPDGVSRLLLRQTGTSGTLKASKRNAAGTITDLATASGALSGSIQSLDVEIVYGCTSGDQFNVWIAGVSVVAYTGASICTDSAASLNQVDFASVNNTAGTPAGCTGTNTGTCWSEVIVATTDTRGMSLWTLNPQAAGNAQSWLPNTLANVNKGAINDATSIATSSSSAISEWTTPLTPPSGSWGVNAIITEARIEVGTSSPETFEWMIRTINGGASDNVTGSVSPTTSFSNFQNIWSTNPNTALSWVISDIATGFNIGIESQP